MENGICWFLHHTVSMSRECLCCFLFYCYRAKFITLVEKIASDRESVTASDSYWTLTQRYCRKEVVVLAVVICAFIVAFFFVVVAGILFLPNKYHVPFNYSIVGLPESYPFVVWMINYAHQFYWITFLYLCYLLKFIVTIFFLNHSCWLIDSTLVFADVLDHSLIQDDDSSSMGSIHENMRKIKDMVQSIVHWQDSACELLALNFLAIFMLQFTVNCFLLFLFSKHSAGSYVAIYGMMMMLNEIFFYCWMGSRVEGKLDELTDALQGLRWDLMKPRQRKDLSLMLLMSQNIQTYNGIFWPVNVETFQAVSSWIN